MKANEFVKKFGWEEAKKIVGEFNYNSRNKFITSLKDNSAINIYDLKRLIESHELVEKVGGLSMAKDFYENFECVHVGLDLVSCRSLGKAILDVESCK